MKLLSLLLLAAVAALLVVGPVFHAPAGGLALADESADAQEHKKFANDVDVDDDDDDAGASVSEDDEDDEDDEQDFGFGQPTVDVTMMFTNIDDNKFPAGKMVKSVIGFTNTGESDESYTVRLVEGSIRYPQDFSYHIQNFTRDGHEVAVAPKEQATFEYFFRPDSNFDPRAFGLVINLYYLDKDQRPYMHTVFNQTVEIVEADEGFDTEAFFLGVIGVSAAALVVFFVGNNLTGKKKGKSRVETGTRATADADWLAGTHANVGGSARKGKSKKH